MRGEEVLTYGILEKTVNSLPEASLCEEIRRNGYGILKSVFTAEQCLQLRSELERIYTEQLNANGDTLLALISDKDNVRCPLGYSRTFLEVSANEKVLSVLRIILGPNFVLLMQNGIINRPESDQQQTKWHRDLNYQHWVSTKPLALNFLICLNEFSADGGATWVLPGSHLFEPFPSDEYVLKNQICLEAPVGSVLILDCMTFHRAGINRRPNFTRMAINHVVGLPFLSQQISIPKMLTALAQNIPEDEWLRSYLGFKWNPAANDAEWREKKGHSLREKADQKRTV